MQRYEPEKRIISHLYSSLAAMARTSSLPSARRRCGTQISDAQEKLAGLHRDHGPEAERLIFLLNQAERIRLSTLTLGRLARRLLRDPNGTKASEELVAVIASAAEMLESIGRCALRGEQPANIHKLVVPAHLHPMPDGKESAFYKAILLDARQQLDALGGQIRAAAGAIVRAGDTTGYAIADSTVLSRMDERVAKLRANLSIQSTVFRHALRLTLCLGLGDALGRSLSLQRTYWIPMTIAIVLKPDFTGTLSRGVLRIAGTYVGLLLATFLFHFIHAGIATDVALMAVFTFLLRWVGPANYGIFVVALSSMIVLLIATTGVPPMQVIVARAINTSFGVLLAMLAYIAWPTWEKANVSSTLADMLDAYRVYFQFVIQAYETGSTEAIDRVRVAGRRAVRTQRLPSTASRLNPAFAPTAFAHSMLCWSTRTVSYTP